jgi:phage-related protein
MGNKLHELRVHVQDGIYRTLYFAATRQRFARVHSFQKKTQRTPK